MTIVEQIEGDLTVVVIQKDLRWMAIVEQIKDKLTVVIIRIDFEKSLGLLGTVKQGLQAVEVQGAV
jgi:hypothetical protein